MRSARRQKLILNRRKESRGSRLLFKLVYFLIAFAAVWIFLALNTKYWNGEDKVGYVYRNDNGDVNIRVLDPKLSESVTLIIPGDTQVTVARNLGTMRIKNVWQLGINEKLNGNLLAETVTKNFLSPVILWSDGDIGALETVSISGILKFIITPTKTNIQVGDRISLALFSLRVKNINSTVIDLGKSQFLKKTKLNDGEVGYIVNGPVSGRLTVNFSDSDFSEGNVRVDIQDATGVSGTANIVGQIVEVMGGKVVSINRVAEESNLDCVVLGVNPVVVKKTATLFGCKISKDKSVFDLEIRLGALFAKRY